MADVRLGPLSFIAPSAPVGEAVGDGLDVVGAALTASERRPRPLKLTLPVRGDDGESEPRNAGLLLRRNVRELFDNARWRLQGFYFTWSVDPDLDCWLLIGSAELTETDPGITFGEYDFQLSDVYIAGRPGTHRPGRRASIGDRRTGLVPRDTRRLLYSTDFSTQEIPLEPLILPGDIASIVRSSGVAETQTGEIRGSRLLFKTAKAADGEVYHYVPDPAVLSDRFRYLSLDEAGAVRVWDLSQATTYPPVTGGYEEAKDADPTQYGWKPVYGSLLSADRPLAVDNGMCRLIWLGAGGVAVEYWNNEEKHYNRIGTVLNIPAVKVTEQAVIELTPERAVLEWRAGRWSMRAVLQRGWRGPRLESYDDAGGIVKLGYVPTGSGTATATTGSPTSTREIKVATGSGTMYWATGSADETVTTGAVEWSGSNGATFSRTGVLVAQLIPKTPATPGVLATDAAKLALIDAQAIPVLVGR
jgi:hypothetical protein